MSISEFTLRLLILLLPGVISLLIIEKLTTHKDNWNQFHFVIYSFLLGFSAYLTCQILIFVYYGLSYLITHSYEPYYLSFWSALSDNKAKIIFGEVFWACVLSFFQSFLITAAIQKKWLYKLAKTFHISYKYGDENLFSFFLNAEGLNWVYVRDIKNNLTYLGLRDSFSETDKIQEIVLTNVKVYRYKDSELLYEMQAVYLSCEIGNLIIEMPQTTRDNSKNETRKRHLFNRGIKKGSELQEQQSTTPSSTTPSSNPT